MASERKKAKRSNQRKEAIENEINSNQMANVNNESKWQENNRK